MKTQSISDSEWKVLQVLWRHPGITLKEIFELVGSDKWTYTTVRTLVNRLAEKGFVTADKSIANNFKYYAAVNEKDCKLDEAQNFLSRVFDGSLSMLVSTLAGKAPLSENEQKELMDLISKMDKKEV